MRWLVNATPRPLYPRYPLYRKLGGPQARSGRVRKISPPPGFDTQTVQPVASRCTDYVIPAATYPCAEEYLHRCNKATNMFHRDEAHFMGVHFVGLLHECKKIPQLSQRV